MRKGGGIVPGIALDPCGKINIVPWNRIKGEAGGRTYMLTNADEDQKDVRVGRGGAAWSWKRILACGKTAQGKEPGRDA